MVFFKKEEKKEETIIPKRIKNLDRSSLLQWFDTSIMNLGASFDQWRYHGAPESEVTESLDALVAIWTELQQRVDDQR
jgi:hypothetical protein